MSTQDPAGDPGQSTSPPRVRGADRSTRPDASASEAWTTMSRCASCDAPNVSDRELCWRCLRDLADPAPKPESRDMTHVVEAALGRAPAPVAAPPAAGTPLASPVAPPPPATPPQSRTVPTAPPILPTPMAAPRAPGASPTGASPPAAAAYVPPDLTPIKVTPIRREPVTIMPASWPPLGQAQRGHGRARRAVLGSIAALLTLAIAGVVLVGGFAPGRVDDGPSTGPMTASVVDPSTQPTVEPTAAPVEPEIVAPAAEETAAADQAAVVAEMEPTPIPTPVQTPKPSRRPRATTVPGPAEADEAEPPTAVEASTSGMRSRKGTNAFTCDGDAAPIRDPYDRTWGVTKVSYSTQGAFERVILHLRRIGEARPGRRTSAIAGRVPTARIGDFPEDVRPEKKRRRLLRVDLAGVPSGPDLRAFRLLGLGHVGELSLLPSRNGRTALLAIDSDACYRVQVPTWGAGAAPEASQAEVVIDVKRP